MKSIEWLDMAREKLGGISDYALAKKLGFTRSAMSAHRTGKVTTLSNETALQIADILGEEPLRIIADQQAEQAKTDEVRRFWLKIAAAAVLILTINIGSENPLVSRAYANNGRLTDYTLCEQRRRRRNCGGARPGTKPTRRRRHDRRNADPRPFHHPRRRPVPGRLTAHYPAIPTA